MLGNIKDMLEKFNGYWLDVSANGVHLDGFKRKEYSLSLVADEITASVVTEKLSQNAVKENLEKYSARQFEKI